MSRADEPTVLPDEDDEITTDVDPAWVAGIRARDARVGIFAWSGGRRSRWRGPRDDGRVPEPMWDPEATVGVSDGLIERIRQEVRAAPSRPVAAPTPAPPAPPPRRLPHPRPPTAWPLCLRHRRRSSSDRSPWCPLTSRPPRRARRGRDPDRSRGAERRRTHLDHGALGTTSTSRRNCARDRNSPDHPLDTPRARPDEGRDRPHRGRGARDRRLARRRFTRQRRPRTARRLRPDLRRHGLDFSPPQRTRRPGRRRRMTSRPLPIVRVWRQSIGRPAVRSTATNLRTAVCGSRSDDPSGDRLPQTGLPSGAGCRAGRRIAAG